MMMAKYMLLLLFVFGAPSVVLSQPCACYCNCDSTPPPYTISPPSGISFGPPIDTPLPYAPVGTPVPSPFGSPVSSPPLAAPSPLPVESPISPPKVSDGIFNVIDYGAVGDGVTDDTQAFEDAWKQVCESSQKSPVLLVPEGKSFLLHPTIFNGESCQSHDITFQIDGDLVAPSDLNSWEVCNGYICPQWIEFDHFSGLTIRGSGVLNGQGKSWWHLSCEECGEVPKSVVIRDCNDVNLNNLRFENSPSTHISIMTSTWVHASNLTIKAPKSSPYTDGIEIQASQNITVDYSIIGTGDDCRTLGDGASFINITNIKCEMGHGISIGSLGGNSTSDDTVENVRITDCSFDKTQHGIQIKTWLGGKGYARNIAIERITFHRTYHPIMIDQFYCPHHHCETGNSAVQISNITYNQIYGTSNENDAVEIMCSDTIPCTNILMKDVNLRSIKSKHETSSKCSNVEGVANDNVYPHVSCLRVDKNL